MKLNLASEYYQISDAENSFAFAAPKKYYEFHQITFDITNMSDVFQGLINLM